MDRGAWRATAHGVTKIQTRLSTHNNILAAIILKELHCASLTIFLGCHFKKKNRERDYLGNTDEAALAHNEKHDVRINFNYL